MSDLYRKTSLERISNPEQLDRAITVSSPMSWLALIGVAVIIAATCLWAFLGKLPQTITLTGVVTESADSWAVTSSVSGTLKMYNAEVGTDVNKGTVIATLQLDDGSEARIAAEIDGTVSRLLCDESVSVGVGTEIARITPKTSASNKVVVCYLPLNSVSAVDVENNPKVTVSTGGETEKTNSYEASVIAKGKFAVNPENDALYNSGTSYLQFNPVASVVLLCELPDQAEIENGTLVTAKVVVGTTRPIDKLPIGKAFRG